LAEETTKQVEWALIVFEAIVYDALNRACGQKIDVLCKRCDYCLQNESLRLRAGNGRGARVQAGAANRQGNLSCPILPVIERAA
jgi:hypothetical protein